MGKIYLIGAVLILNAGVAQAACTNGTVYGTTAPYNCTDLSSSDHWETDFRENVIDSRELLGGSAAIGFFVTDTQYAPNITFNGSNLLSVHSLAYLNGVVTMRLNGNTAENAASIRVSSGHLSLESGDTAGTSGIRLELGEINRTSAPLMGAGVFVQNGANLTTRTQLNGIYIKSWAENSTANLIVDMSNAGAVDIQSKQSGAITVSSTNTSSFDSIWIDTRKMDPFLQTRKLSVLSYSLDAPKQYGINAESSGNIDIYSSGEINMNGRGRDGVIGISAQSSSRSHHTNISHEWGTIDVVATSAESAAISANAAGVVNIHNKDTSTINSTVYGIYADNRNATNVDGNLFITNDGTINTGYEKTVNTIKYNSIHASGIYARSSQGDINVVNHGLIHVSAFGEEDRSFSSAIEVEQTNKSGNIYIQNTGSIINDKTIKYSISGTRYDAPGISAMQTYEIDVAAGDAKQLMIENAGIIKARSLGILATRNLSPSASSYNDLGDAGHIIITNERSGLIYVNENDPDATTEEVYGIVAASFFTKTINQNGTLIVDGAKSIGIHMLSGLHPLKNIVSTVNLGGDIRANRGIHFISGTTNIVNIAQTGTIVSDSFAIGFEGDYYNSYYPTTNTVINYGHIESRNSDVIKHWSGGNVASLSIENNGVITGDLQVKYNGPNDGFGSTLSAKTTVINNGVWNIQNRPGQDSLLDFGNHTENTFVNNGTLKLLNTNIGTGTRQASYLKGLKSFTLQGDGLIDMINEQSDTLTIDGIFVANGGVIKMEVGSQNNDFLKLGSVLKGAAQTKISINAAQLNQDVQLMEVGSYQSGAFTLTNALVSGAYEYNIVNNGTGLILSSQNVTPVEPPVNPINPPVNPINPGGGNGIGAINNFGSLVDYDQNRNIRADAGVVMANQTAVTALLSPIHFAGDFTKAGGLRAQSRIGVEQGDGGDSYTMRHSFWLTNAYHDMKSTLANQVEQKSKIFTVQLGYNHNIDVGSSALLEFGISGGYNDVKTDSKSNRTATKSEGTVKGYNFALSGSYYFNGTDSLSPYVDMMLAYGRYQNTISIKNTYNKDYNSNATMSYIQGGYPIALGSSVAIEPQAQISYIKYHGDSYIDHSSTKISQDNKGFIVTRVGLSVYGRNEDFQPHATINWFNNGQQSAVNLNSTQIRQEKVGNIFELKGGIQFKPTQNFMISAELGIQAGNHKYRDYNGTLGFKYIF